VTLEPGNVDFDLVGRVHGDCFGLVLVDGLLVAELEAGRARTAWLVGEDDLIRPSATLALHSLERNGVLSCTAKGVWLLHRSGSASGHRAACIPQFERSLGLS
jgi:hypothetical protein